MGNQHKAFLFLDFLFSLLPVILMLALALQLSYKFISESESNLNNQILLNKLISISDYVIRYAAAEKNQNFYLPNKISNSEFSSLNMNDLEEKLGISNLYIGFEEQQNTCNCRIVLYENKIEKLYFCGEIHEYS